MSKLMIAADEKFMGPGSFELLGYVRETGSVRLACERMGLSYSKAWHILNTLEKEAGFAVVSRKKGGSGGGETHLTEEGASLLRRYALFVDESRAAIAAIFAHHFPEAIPQNEESTQS